MKEEKEENVILGVINGLKEAGQEILFENPVGPWCLAGSATKYMGAVTVSYYKPLYFSKVYPDFIDQFSVGNALAYAILGSFSAIAGGIISDKLESKSYMTKSYVVMIGTGLAIPFMYGCLFV